MELQLLLKEDNGDFIRRELYLLSEEEIKNLTPEALWGWYLKLKDRMEDAKQKHSQQSENQ